MSGGTASTHYSSYFSDLVPNMLGCFMIGLLSNHQAIGIKTSKPLACLSRKHVFQQLSSLHVSGQWAEAVWGWVIGTELAMVSLVFGEQMAQYCHKWFSKEEPVGQGARLNETLEPITGLEDQDKAYGHHGRQPVHVDPEAVKAHPPGHSLEPITGLEDQTGAYANPDRQQHQPEPKFHQLRGKLKSYPKDDDPRLPTSDSFHRLADAAEAVRQPEGHSMETQSNDAAGNKQQAEAGHAAGRSHLNDAHMQDRDPLTTTQSDIMDSHAALFSSNKPSSSHMYDMLHEQPQIAAVPQHTVQEQKQEQEQKSLHLQNGEQQQSREARKLDDPGQADGDRQAQPGCESQPQTGIISRFPMTISSEAFWNSAALMLATAITALFVVLTVIDAGEHHEGRRGQWLAVLFAPAGAILRWQLSKLNGRMPQPLTFFPAGTFAANMLACACDFAVQSAIVARQPLSYWPSLVTTALKNGFMGSLSTVSTFATELRVLFKTVPDTLHAYIYLMSTILGGVALGIAIYGWADWQS
ncbi:hypothetical protein WJX74_003303 [Apatococcus lobatus]|uniref:Fluoride ion transporter CrcB n=1 Tax=Apatococcus lobatus TaxID=904363 RepID=A0AAW1QVT0_9CHLO